MTATSTSTTSLQINDLIGWMKKNNRAARAARILLRCFGVVFQTTTWNFHIWISSTRVHSCENAMDQNTFYSYSWYFPLDLVPNGNALSLSPISVKWGEKKICFGCLFPILFGCTLSSGPSNLADISLQALQIADTSTQCYFNQCNLATLFDCKSLPSALKWTAVHSFLKMITPSFLTFVLGILITTFIYPWYNDTNDKGKNMIALFSPLTGVILKVISRICVQRLWNIKHPGYS